MLIDVTAHYVNTTNKNQSFTLDCFRSLACKLMLSSVSIRHAPPRGNRDALRGLLLRAARATRMKTNEQKRDRRMKPNEIATRS